MLKGSGLLTAALVAVFTWFCIIFAGGQAAAKGQDGLPGYSQPNTVQKIEFTDVRKLQVSTVKKTRVAKLKKRSRYATKSKRARLASYKKRSRYATYKKRARYAQIKKRARYAKLRKTRQYARYKRRGVRDRFYTASARRNPAIVAAVKAHARAAGVPVGVALAVVRQESGFNPRATGGVGEIGLMQLRCSTAKGIGYRGSCRGLYNVSTNLRYGMRYLRMALNRGSVGYYNAGVGARRLPYAARRYAASVHRKIRRV